MDFDEDERLVFRVLDAVGGANRDVDCRTGRQSDLLAIKGHERHAGDDNPVLGPLGVLLVTEPLPGLTSIRFTLYPSFSSRTV